MTEEELSKMISEFLPYPAEGQHHALKQFARLVAAAERQKLQHELLTLEKWKGMALAKDGDGRTVQELQREAREAEREKVAQWMMQRGYATGHGDTTEDLLAELDWQIKEKWSQALMYGIITEREACASVCDKLGDEYADANAAHCAFAIRERGAP